MKSVAVLLASIVMLFGCAESTNMRELKLIIEKGPIALESDIPFVADFLKSVPHSRITIARFIDGDPFKREVQCAGYLYERYMVTADFSAEFFASEGGVFVKSATQPEIVISEIQEIRKTPDGRYILDFGRTTKMTSENLVDLVEGREPGSAARLKKHDPLHGFSNYIEAIR